MCPALATQPSTTVFVPPPRGETAREEQLKKSRNDGPEGEVLLYTATLTPRVCTLTCSSISSRDFAPALAEKVEKYNWEKEARVSSAGHQLAQSAQSFLKTFLDHSCSLADKGQWAGGGAGCPDAAVRADRCVSSKERPLNVLELRQSTKIWCCRSEIATQLFAPTV